MNAENETTKTVNGEEGAGAGNVTQQTVKVYTTEPGEVFGTDEYGDYYENFADATIVETSRGCQVYANAYQVVGGRATLQIETKTREQAERAVAGFFALFKIEQYRWEELS